MRSRAWVLAGGITAAALAIGGLARAGAQQPPDDLTVVKRAVAPSSKLTVVKQAAEEGPAPAAKSPASPARAGKPQWFKVRVIEKGTKKARVTVNLPLALVRAFGDTPFDWRCGGEANPGRRCSVKVADVLEALEAGQELVEVDDEEATVKIWVE